MRAIRTDWVRPLTSGHPKDRPVPRAASRRPLRRIGAGFATLLLAATWLRPAAAGYPLDAAADAAQARAAFTAELDADANGVEDLLDAWSRGRASWTALRDRATAAARARADADKAAAPVPAALRDDEGPWARGRVRLLWCDAPAGAVADAADAAPGGVEVLHRLDAFATAVLACDEAGLRALLARAGGGRLMLDRDGVPALDAARPLIGTPRAWGPGWRLGRDWSGTIAILDSGCDTAHGDLGDSNDDDRDGPAPTVGDAADWYPADGGWPLFGGYKVVGWNDVTDDFPAAEGPWDYHHHGTALASVVAGSGAVDPAFAGVAPAMRLTVVKYYDFDVTWHAWAGDFLAACAWTLANHETYRIRHVLTAVNWDTEAGTSLALGRLADAGITVIAAAGNHGYDAGGPGYPARLAGVLTVGGVNDQGAVAGFSGRGTVTDVAKPDLLAPAGGVLPAAGRITAADNEPNDTYSGRWGTSLAAAHAAGAAALLDEALRDRGVVLPADREATLTRAILLETTAQPVDLAETADGAATFALPAWQGPDRHRGWGLMRVDAAVQAACAPLRPGADQLDTLSADWTRPVAARRLATAPGIRYLVEAVPAPGLDIILEVVDPRGMIGGEDEGSLRRDAGGPGVSEFVYVRPGEGRWLFAAVKRRAGSGPVSLRLREADAFAAQGWRRTLPGRLTGAPNAGLLGPEQTPSLVVPSLVAIDDASRAVTVLAAAGTPRPGWPVFVFPPVSAQGGLTQPLVWDLDGQPGDEIVLGSDHGAMVFLTASGQRTVLSYAFNVPLSAPVGLVAAAERRVASVDAAGRARTWAAGGVLRADRALGHALPLAPASGSLAAGADESLVIAFADGHVRVLDADLEDRAGWPRELGTALDTPPVLVDLDGDGGREIVLVTRATGTGLARLHVRDAAGEPGPGDGTVLATPDGGGWVALGAPAVTGRPGAADLGVSVVGLADNGLAGAAARWTLACGVLRADGTAGAATWPGLEIGASTDEGSLVLDRHLLPAPLAWNLVGGTGTEPAALASLSWAEVLYGLTSIPGEATAWYAPTAAGRPLTAWIPAERGGPDATPPGSLGTLLLPGGDGAHLRVDVLDETLTVMPVPAGAGTVPLWTAARGDGRNSAAHPLAAPVSAAPLPSGDGRLAVYPNPGAGRFRFRLDGAGAAGPVRAEIYDVRGRRVRSLQAEAPQALAWDGRGEDGRPLAAGTYLAVVRGGGRSHTARFVLTR